MLPVCIGSYLKSVVRYTFSILDICHPDSLYLREQRCVVIFRKPKGVPAKRLRVAALPTPPSIPQHQSKDYEIISPGQDGSPTFCRISLSPDFMHALHRGQRTGLRCSYRVILKYFCYIWAYFEITECT